MGAIIYPSKIRSKLTSMNNDLDDLNNELTNASSKLGEIEDKRLKGWKVNQSCQI